MALPVLQAETAVLFFLEPNRTLRTTQDPQNCH